VVIATHCNTGCFHNHYVVNSISWLDGTHFDCREDDYQYMREVSDWLCKKYRLSVIEDPKRRRKNHGEYLAEKNGKPTYSKLIRQDIDNAILATDTRTAFFSYLESMGYQLRLYKKNGELREQPSLRPPGAERFFRFQTLGDRYALESIEQRIWKKITKAEPFPEADEEIVMQQRAKYQPPYRRKETGLSGLYVRYRFEIGIIQRYPASVKQVSQFLREDIVKLDRLDAETQLLSKANISNIEELTAYQAELNRQIQVLTEKRKNMRNEQRHCYRQREPGNMEECRQQVADLTRQIAKLKKEVSLCDDIVLRSARTREELEWIIDHQEQTRKENNGHELFRGRSRTDR